MFSVLKFHIFIWLIRAVQLVLKVRRQAKSGGWRQNRRWRRPGNKQYLKRKQLEKVLDRVKTNEKEKEILSALKYVEGICDDGQRQGDGGRLEKSAEQVNLVHLLALYYLIFVWEMWAKWETDYFPVNFYNYLDLIKNNLSHVDRWFCNSVTAFIVC